ncbi:MAG: hypothetical protein AAB903_03400, partial [Patescibacteria group bacterium]
AVLSVVVVLTLNPAELLRQARDSTRISDMSSLNSALSLLLADGGVFAMGPGCFAATSTPSASCGSIGFQSLTPAISSTLIIVTSARGTTGDNGWMQGVNFGAISSGAPFGILPVDPTNNTSYFYGFAVGSSSTYKLNSRMESTKYSGSGSSAVGVNDGGTSTSTYEVGNTLSL